jgi:hypothetical protein
MGLANQTICKRCHREMEEVATIVPIGGSPGLVAYLCHPCGETDSILFYRTAADQQRACDTR